MLFIRPVKDAILKQTENWNSLSHGSAPPGEFVALCGNNQIEATKPELVRIRLLKLKVRQG